MKIGDAVKLCTDTYQLDAFISGEHEDGRSIGYWLVDCPEMKINNAVFCKESINDKYYNFAKVSTGDTPRGAFRGNCESWIVEIDNSLEQVIELVDNWMSDDSGYDENTYPEIEAVLTNGR
jgi:hypothetical protein